MTLVGAMFWDASLAPVAIGAMGFAVSRGDSRPDAAAAQTTTIKSDCVNGATENRNVTDEGYDTYWCVKGVWTFKKTNSPATGVDLPFMPDACQAATNDGIAIVSAWLDKIDADADVTFHDRRNAEVTKVLSDAGFEMGQKAVRSSAARHRQR